MQCNEFIGDCGASSTTTTTTSTNDVVDGCPVVINKTGLPCGEISGLEILDEFRELYKARIKNIDKHDDKSSELKIKIMTEWIRDLDEQNTMLVKTVKELEDAACSRVKVLEHKLQETSGILSNSMTQIGKPSQDTLNDLAQRINYLEQEEQTLKNNIEYLNSDIRGLIQLLERISTKNHWNLEGIDFFSINKNDIPIPNEWTSGQGGGDDDNVDKIEYQMELHHRIADLNKIIQNKEEKIQIYKSKFELLRDKLNKRQEVDGSDDDIIQMLELVGSELNKDKSNENSIEDVDCLKFKIEDKTRIIQELTDQLNKLEKESLETREALAVEVAEKHDSNIRFKNELTDLGENYNLVTKKLKYQDELIKKMRDQLKNDKTDISSSSNNKKIDENKNDNIISSLEKIKNMMETESNCLLNLKQEFFTIHPIFNNMEKYKIDSEEFITSINKLSKNIDKLSSICLEKTKSIIEFEYVLQEVRENKNIIIENDIEITREQFGLMAEFRLCTVEVQASTEDIKDEIEEILSCLKSRNNVFIELKKLLSSTNNNIHMKNDNIKKLINNLKADHDEKMENKMMIVLQKSNLKDIENEMIEMFNRIKNNTPDNAVLLLIKKALDTIDNINCRLNVFVTKETEGLSLFNDANLLLDDVNKNTNTLETEIKQVLINDGVIEKIFTDRFKKLDKIESELDYAHTRLQDNLENIIAMSERAAADDDDDDKPVKKMKIEQLVESLSSKDKLLEHKEEIIRIQKSSIQVAEEELKNLDERLQMKINEQVRIINNYLEEKKHLIEQSQLQNQTIRHLQDALVDAKKGLSKSPIISHRDNKTPTVFNNNDIQEI
ncbi:hypothetical protein HCN44_008699 [Aphidius gifuensis]|uniref:Uncharacterized protein n=1 Tax=Aphidius gifuensis TaxID=684658 RepID=A0A834XQX8_APHGI|nr:hypothetical protein HCN44_008699 [Aphidius gifuensis]